jgi:hypothetical protein
MASERLSREQRWRLEMVAAGDWLLPGLRRATDEELERLGLIQDTGMRWELTPAGRALLEGGD